MYIIVMEKSFVYMTISGLYLQKLGPVTGTSASTSKSLTKISSPVELDVAVTTQKRTFGEFVS